MQIEYIPAQGRGLTQTHWLKSYHTYSFGSYHNLKRLNFGTLRVFNDDIIGPSMGFNTHSHDNMEIVTIVLSGKLKHKDSSGNEGILQPGDVQRMSAGTGIKHSEHNASDTEPLHLLQIWIYPEKRDLTPSYEQKNFSPSSYENAFLPIVTSSPSETALNIHQDASFYIGNFQDNETISHHLRSKQHGAYLFVIDGGITLDGRALQGGDSAQITEADTLEFQTVKPSKILLIEIYILPLG